MEGSHWSLRQALVGTSRPPPSTIQALASKPIRWAAREVTMADSSIKGGRVFSVSRLRGLRALMVLATGASLIACRKDAPKKEPEKPAPVVVKKSPEEIKRLADTATQSLGELKPTLEALSEKYK